jgi:Transposase DDE domain
MGMRTIIQATSAHIIDLIESLRRQLCDADFIARQRVRPVDFTRQRQLTFPVVMLFILQKTVKSLQRHLHEFLDELAGGELFEGLTAGAFTHARAKLKHTAFIELNEQSVLPSIYGAQTKAEIQRWHGHRLLGVDSSLLRLPNSVELRQQFSVVEVSNQLGSNGAGYPEARMSVIYDLLNRVGLDGRLEPSRLGEVDLAIEQLVRARPGDVMLNDRGFTGFVYLASHHKLELNYIARCSSASFCAAQELFRKNRGGCSLRVKVMAAAVHRAELRRLGLPLELIVRFVSLRLPTGELEVLATSLLDEVEYPTEEFLAVYHSRWKHETFYGVMKGRLDLENFSGQTAEAVRQDFHAALLLCNLETVLSAQSAVTLAQQSATDRHPKQINRAVAFHALKDQLLDLLYSDTPVVQVMRQLQRLLLGCPVSVRPERKPPRRKPSLNRSYHFQRRVRKIVF